MSEREPDITTGQYISFPVTDGVVRRLLRLAATAIVLSGIHAYLRLAGKGLEFEWDGKKLPSSIPDAQIDEAIRLFDRRVEEDNGDFGVAGTRVFSSIGRTTTPTAESSPALLVAARNDWDLVTTFIGPLRNGRKVMTMVAQLG